MKRKKRICTHIRNIETFRILNKYLFDDVMFRLLICLALYLWLLYKWVVVDWDSAKCRLITA